MANQEHMSAVLITADGIVSEQVFDIPLDANLYEFYATVLSDNPRGFEECDYFYLGEFNNNDIYCIYYPVGNTVNDSANYLVGGILDDNSYPTISGPCIFYGDAGDNIPASFFARDIYEFFGRK